MLDQHQFCCRRDEEGSSGVKYVVKVILHLLDPLVSEFSASYVGKLILVLMKKVCPTHCAVIMLMRWWVWLR